eukprot:gene5754-11626_t
MTFFDVTSNIYASLISSRQLITTAALISQAMAILFLVHRVHKINNESIDIQHALEKEHKLRQGERIGRISTQKRARKAIKNKISAEGFSFRPIGHIESPFPSRCGTPRQPNLVSAARGHIRFDKKQIQFEHYKELEEFSHIWIVWIFHENTNIDSETTPAKISPPRLNGQKVGCLSTRSPHRPNAIGLSVVQVQSVHKDGIDVIGVDMVFGTPILDVKPYLHYDVIPRTLSHCICPGETVLRMPAWIEDADVPERAVVFQPAALEGLHDILLDKRLRYCSDETSATNLITQVLRQDIRSVHQGRGSGKSPTVYRCQLDAMIVAFLTEEQEVVVVDIRAAMKMETLGMSDSLSTKSNCDNSSNDSNNDNINHYDEFPLPHRTVSNLTLRY